MNTYKPWYETPERSDLDEPEYTDHKHIIDDHDVYTEDWEDERDIETYKKWKEKLKNEEAP